jgi:ankyrin repeat protein
MSNHSCGGQTPLFRACRPSTRTSSGPFLPHYQLELAALKMMIDYGSNLHAKDDAGNTPLHIACLLRRPLQYRDEDDKGQEKMVRMLLQQGVKGDVSNRAGVTPFETAFRAGLLGVCDVLVRHRNFPRKREDFDRMLLYLIHERPLDWSALDLLLDLDADGNLVSTSTYLMRMVDQDVRMAARYLERCSAQIGPHLNPKEKLTILQAGLTHKHHTLTKQMLAMRVSVNSPDANGHTPLYVTLHEYFPGKGVLVEALLKAGSNIYFKPPSSTIITPLEKAILSQDHALVALMLQHQPLRNNPTAPKGVYLHAAARAVAPSKRMISTLIRSGASVTELDGNGDSPLSAFLKSIANLSHRTAHPRRATTRVCATVWYLWNKKVDINLRNKSGKAITSYLSALRMYDGDDPVRQRIAEDLKLALEIVPAQGEGEKGLKTLRFRHALAGLGNLHGGPEPPTLPPSASNLKN